MFLLIIRTVHPIHNVLFTLEIHNLNKKTTIYQHIFHPTSVCLAVLFTLLLPLALHFSLQNRTHSVLMFGILEAQTLWL